MSHAVTVPLGTGGGLSGGPSGQTRTGPQDGDLQSGTDNGGHGRAGSFGGHGGAGSSEGHGRCKELRRPWWCRELRRPWQVVFHGRGLVPRPGHSSRNPFTPPKKKKFPGEVRGYQEPSGARQTGQYMTRQENPPGPDKQDRTSHRNQKPYWAGLEAEASSGHDEESGALTGSLSNRFHINDREAGSWNGFRGHKTRSRLPQTSLQGQDRQDLIKMFLWAQQDTNTALLAVTCGLDPRG